MTLEWDSIIPLDESIQVYITPPRLLLLLQLIISDESTVKLIGINS